MRRTQSEIWENKLSQLKWLLIILSTLVFLLSLTLFSICIWIRFDLDFWEWVEELDWYNYWNCMYVSMASMIICVITNLALVYGSVSESRPIMIACMFFLFVTICLNFAGAIAICIYGVEESDTLTANLRHVFLRQVYNMDIDHRKSRILKMVQEYVGCCGAIGSEDYTKSFKPVPMECRDPITGNEYRYGCAQQFAWWLEPWTATLAGVTLGIMLMNMIQMIITGKIMSLLKKYELAPAYYDYDK